MEKAMNEGRFLCSFCYIAHWIQFAIGIIIGDLK